MERSNYFNDQHVLANDLNNTEGTKASQSVYRTQAPLGDSGGIGQAYSFWSGSVPQGGVYGSPADYLSTAENFYPVQDSPSQITLAPGTGLTANGEIVRLTSTKTINKGSSDNNYIWTTSASQLNYVKLAYFEVSGSVKTDDAGESHPTRYTPSYYITVNGAVPTANDLLLGTFLGDGAGDITTTIQDRRTYVRTVTPANAVILDPTVKPVSAHTTVEDHVRSVGSGNPTVTNPHGISAGDLGFVDSVEEHRRDAHVNGIMIHDYSGAWNLSYLGTIVSPTANAYISFGPPVNATASISGALFSGSVVSLYGSSAPADGNYWVVINSIGTPSFVSASVVDFDSPTTNLHAWTQYLVLGKVTVGDSGDDLSNYLDKRQVYTTSQLQDIQFDFKEGTEDPSELASTHTRMGSLYTNMSRIRGALGLVADGSTSYWNDAFPSPVSNISQLDTDLTAVSASVAPLLVGATGSVDAYHTHTYLPLYNPSRYVKLFDDFVGGGEIYGNIGELGWASGSNAGATSIDRTITPWDTAAIGVMEFKADHSSLGGYLTLPGKISPYGGAAGGGFAGGTALRISLRLAQAASANFSVRVGFLDNLGSSFQPTNGIYFEAAGTGNWFGITRSGGSQSTQDLGSAPSNVLTSNLWFILHSSGLKVDFLYNATYKGTLSADIPTGYLNLAISVLDASAALSGVRLDYVLYEHNAGIRWA